LVARLKKLQARGSRARSMVALCQTIQHRQNTPDLIASHKCMPELIASHNYYAWIELDYTI
jgi:hypothetical protein